MKRASKFISVLLASTLILSSTVFGATGVSRITFTRNTLDTNGISVDSSLASAFTDVEGEDGAYIAAAKQANIVSGYQDNTFKPEDAITMEQAVVIALNGKGLQGQVNALTDEEVATILGNKAGDVSKWARQHVAYAVENNVVDLATFQAKNMITEDQAGTIIHTTAGIQADKSIAKEPQVETKAEATEDTTAEMETPVATDEATAKTGQSAADMLLKSSELSNAESTYKMSGTTNTTQKITMGAETVNTTSKTKIDATFEMPDKLYINIEATVTAPGQEKPVTVPMEIYMNGKTLYLKGEGISDDWKEMDSTLIDLESLTGSNNMLTSKQIESFSNDISFGEDKIVDGKTLHAIKVDISSEAFKAIMQETFESTSTSMTGLVDGILDGTGTTLTAEEKTLMNDVLDQAVKNMVMTGHYTYYIDSETMLPVQADVTMTITMPIEIMGETMSIVSDSISSLKLYAYGEAIEFPVVK